MEDVNISKFRAQVVRAGSTPASPGFVVSEGQNPVDPSGSGQNHLPVTIATVSTGLSITESQILSGAGLVSQYIRGDGSLADFPATTGGGSSVSYYLNGSVSQGTIGGVAYREVNRTPIFGAGTDITINADGYIASFITDALDPNKLLIPAGNWNLETYFSASSSGGSPSFYVELYKYNGTTFTLIATSSSAPELIAFGTNLNPYYSTLAVPETVLALTDRLALRYYVTHSGRTITLHTENNHLCQVITTFTTGLTALNGLTSQVQYLTVGTSGTDFAISSASDTHTFNLPTASATNRGALSSADWTTFNNKTSNLGTVTSVGLSSATSGVTIGSTPITTSGTITLAIATASGSQNGLLSSTDWTTFNNKQNALTNPVTGTGASGQVAYFTGTSAISSESNLFWDATNDRLGIGTAIPDSTLHIVKSSATTNNYVEAIHLEGKTTGTVANGFGPSIGFWGSMTGQNNVELAQIAALNTAVAGAFGDLVFYTRPNAPVQERMRIFSNGNVFIGSSATDSGYKLDVNGTGRFNGTVTFNDLVTTTSVYRITQASVARGGLYTYNQWIGSGTDYSIGLASEVDLFFSTGGVTTKKVIFTSAGNVLIGPTSDAGYKLDVNGTGRFSGSLSVIKSSGGSVFTLQSTATNGEAQVDLEGRNSSGTVRNATFKYDNTDIIRIGTSSNIGMRFETNDAERMRITSGGNVGIGTTSPGHKIDVLGASGNITSDMGNGTIINIDGGSITSTNFGVGIGFVRTGSQMAYIKAARENASDEAAYLAFATQTGAGTHPERMRITSKGYLKASNNGSYVSSTGNYHEFNSSVNDDQTITIRHTGSAPYGIYMAYTGASPNNTSKWFAYFEDSTAVRFFVKSNGGINNYQANNLDLSDERVKKDIEPLESYWDKFKAIEIVKFKYIDQTHDDFNIGVIAQQVEAVAPEFVDVDGWGDKPKLDEEGNKIVTEEEPLKSIYTADLHHATIKVLQEAMAKIEKLEKEIHALKS
jgi:hypothetical protein